MVCSRHVGESMKLQHRATKDANDFWTKAIDNHPVTQFYTKLGESYLKWMTSAMAPK